MVGHDWDAGIGWNLVYNHPERVVSWSALSVPHNRAFGKVIKIDKEQRKKSGYIKWLLIPVMPEIVLRWNDLSKFRKLWKNSEQEELEAYLKVFRRKSSMTAVFNYYRANIGKGKNESIKDIHVSTLFIWGKHDEAVGQVAAEGCAKYMKGDYTYLPVDGGHWLLQTNYEEVERAVVDHITKRT